MGWNSSRLKIWKKNQKKKWFRKHFILFSARIEWFRYKDFRVKNIVLLFTNSMAAYFSPFNYLTFGFLGIRHRFAGKFFHSLFMLFSQFSKKEFRGRNLRYNDTCPNNMLQSLWITWLLATFQFDGKYSGKIFGVYAVSITHPIQNFDTFTPSQKNTAQLVSSSSGHSS